jgi:hypothetical protein
MDFVGREAASTNAAQGVSRCDILLLPLDDAAVGGTPLMDLRCQANSPAVQWPWLNRLCRSWLPLVIPPARRRRAGRPQAWR